MTTTCAICTHAFESRNSYGICPRCFNKDVLREWDRLQHAIKQAEKLYLPVSLSLLDWLSILSDHNGVCAYCQIYTFSNIEMVHPLVGLTPENVVPSCRACHEHKKHGFDTALERVQAYCRGEYHPDVIEPLFDLTPMEASS